MDPPEAAFVEELVTEKVCIEVLGTGTELKELSSTVTVDTEETV